MKDPVLEHIVQQIAAHFAPERIYLFGSRLRGDCDAESDYDLLVVAEMPHIPKRERALAVRRTFPLREFGLDVIVKTPREFEEGANTRNHICSVIRDEGAVVYER